MTVDDPCIASKRTRPGEGGNEEDLGLYVRPISARIDQKLSEGSIFCASGINRIYLSGMIDLCADGNCTWSRLWAEWSARESLGGGHGWGIRCPPTSPTYIRDNASASMLLGLRCGETLKLPTLTQILPRVGGAETDTIGDFG
jgi:hypothetical protein